MDTDDAPRLDSLLRAARQRLAPGEAELLMAHLLGRSHGWLFAHGDAPVDADVAARFAALVDRRAGGEPVAYLTGRRGFWRLDLEVTPDTLIPRAETEVLVEEALRRIPRRASMQVADLGTGSGAIALSIASERPECSVVATDSSVAALEVARRNAALAGLGNVEFRVGDWLQALAGERYDVIACNPPYIAVGDAHLEQGDLRHEPRSALASGPDGLDDIGRIVCAAPGHLLAGGWLLLEHGHDQGPRVRELLATAGFQAVATVQDLEHRDRVSLGCMHAGR
jgi:release factor glutamine methyltransferase